MAAQAVFDFRKPDRPVKTEKIKCLMIHPVFASNKGPLQELYQAEEAIGLVKSLGWSVLKGPCWDDAPKEKSIFA